MELQIRSLAFPLAFFLFIIMFWRIRKKFERNPQPRTPNLNLPPGPWKLPLIGNLHQLVGYALPHQRLTELAKKYGPVMQLQLGEVSTIVISSSEAAKEVMKTHEINFADRPQLLVTDIMYYNCKDIFFAPYGDSWRQLRKICILKMLSARREDDASKFIKSISSKQGLPINLSQMILSLLNDITVRTTIGKKCKNQEALMPIIKEIVEAATGSSIADIFPSVKLFRLTSWTKFGIEKAHREADKILEAII